MKNYFKKSFTIIVFELLIVLAINLLIFIVFTEEKENYHKIDAKRLVNKIDSENITDLKSINLEGFETITRISIFDEDEICNSDYIIQKSKKDGKLYRVEYKSKSNLFEIVITVNIGFLLIIITTLLILLYNYAKILKPFHRFVNLPAELAKGNRVTSVKENKNKYFGKFLWGMDLLRDNLEQAKSEELRLHKEKKTLILSISHDIKTPLSSIKLYTKALQKKLYTDEQKKEEALSGIEKNVCEIEKYVGEIITASQEDFLKLTVENSELYLNTILEKIREYYLDKLSVSHTDFSILPYENSLIYGDEDRLIEVFQNVIENAIKYGDGRYIKLTVASEENFKLVSISNSGNKMKNDEVDHAFDSFYRGTNANDKAGSGLGLYICRQLMQLMDGEIFIDNSSKDFTVTIVIKMA